MGSIMLTIIVIVVLAIIMPLVVAYLVVSLLGAIIPIPLVLAMIMIIVGIICFYIPWIPVKIGGFFVILMALIMLYSFATFDVFTLDLFADMFPKEHLFIDQDRYEVRLEEYENLRKEYEEKEEEVPQETKDWYEEELKKYIKNIGILGPYVNVKAIGWI